MTTTSAFGRQPTKLDYASPTQFKFSIVKLPKVEFFVSSVNIPGISLGSDEQATPLLDLPYPGDKLTYGDLNMTFLVDENLENYLILHNWIRALGTPDDTLERRSYKLKMQQEFGKDNNDLYADGTLMVLNSNFNHNFDVVFEDLMPIGLNALEFNATVDGTEYAMAQVSFRYLAYEIRTKEDTKRNKQLD